MKTVTKRKRSDSAHDANLKGSVKRNNPNSRPTSSSPGSPRACTAATDFAATSSGGVPRPGDAKPCRNALLIVSTCDAVMAGLVYRKEKFNITFSVKRHVGSINSAAVTERYIASSGVDERVFLFTNKAEARLTAATRKKMRERGEPLAVRLADLGSVAPPAEVTALAFADGSQRLLCGCTNGLLILYRCRDWSVSTTLTVHERAVVGLAVHPGSRGSLAVTVGEDRFVAVLDLAKEKLLTKWKYNPSPAPPQNASANEGDCERAAIEKPSVFAPPREQPIGVLFSPKGTRLIIFSRFSFVVYEVAVLQPIYSLRYTNPQPQDEIHCCAFFTETVLLIGTEAGALKVCYIEGMPEEPLHRTAPLAPVSVTYPESLQAGAEALLATPVKAEVEERQKNPLRHINRVKAIQVDGSTVFSIDSSGIVITWNATSTAADPVGLQYVASANCQGRVRDMKLYSLTA